MIHLGLEPELEHPSQWGMQMTGAMPYGSCGTQGAWGPSQLKSEQRDKDGVPLLLTSDCSSSESVSSALHYHDLHTPSTDLF